MGEAGIFHAEDRVELLAGEIYEILPIGSWHSGEVDAFISYVKSSPCAPGEGPLRVPGEGSAGTTKARRRTGVAVQAFTWREILRMADEFGVTPPVNRIVGGSNRTDRDTQTEVNSNS